MLALASAIIQYSIETDVQVLRQANVDDTALAMQTVFNTGFVNGFLPAMIMSILAILQVPKLADWIVESGAPAAVGGFAGRAAQGAKAVTTTVVSAVSGGSAGAAASRGGGYAGNSGSGGGGGYAGGGNSGGSSASGSGTKTS